MLASRLVLGSVESYPRPLGDGSAQLKKHDGEHSNARSNELKVILRNQLRPIRVWNTRTETQLFLHKDFSLDFPATETDRIRGALMLPCGQRRPWQCAGARLDGIASEIGPVQASQIDDDIAYRL